jgi:uncharacterized protein
VFSAEALLNELASIRPVSDAARPIFRWDHDAYAIFYTPGYVCVVDCSDAQRFEQMIAAPSTGDGWERWRSELRLCAELAAARHKAWEEAPFDPVCLTLFMNNACNLACTYCYAQPERYPFPASATRHSPAIELDSKPNRATWLDPDVITAAAQLVAQNCRRRGSPFYVVFHGGGEPTLHRGRADEALSVLEREAAAHDVRIFRYVATNGVMSEKKAVWLARRFDLVGLSCDGPADIQNAQRPLWDGGPTAHRLEQTARILHAQGTRIHVRVTVTRDNMHRQAEIVAYVCEALFPEEVHLEPAYRGGRAEPDSCPRTPDAATFLQNFLQARRVAQQHGVPLIYAGCRLGEIHGPYCNLLRDVLNLVPGGTATACFKQTPASKAAASGMAIGALDEQTGHFIIDDVRVRNLRQRLTASLAACHHCFNRFHCARACPDRCVLDDARQPHNRALDGSFRCLVQKGLALVSLQEHVQRAWPQSRQPDGDGRVYGTAVV